MLPSFLLRFYYWVHHLHQESIVMVSNSLIFHWWVFCMWKVCTVEFYFTCMISIEIKGCGWSMSLIDLFLGCFYVLWVFVHSFPFVRKEMFYIMPILYLKKCQKGKFVNQIKSMWGCFTLIITWVDVSC